MAIIRRFSLLPLQIEAKHTDAAATYSLVKDRDGNRFLQIDSYGSRARKLKGKKSQSLRLSESALRQLKEIIGRHFPRA
jgi:hypothetical protein